MKNKSFTLTDFETEKITKEVQKIIRGGGNDTTDPTSNPLKTNGGGNG